MIERKRWRTLVERGASHHLAIVLFWPGRVARLHTHDFPEIFWIERGAAVHEINGASLPLAAGDLVCIRPEDQHVLRAVDAAGFTLINLAYSDALRADLVRRHPAALRPLLAPATDLPFKTRRGAEAMATLRRRLEPLAATSHARFALEHFLLGLALLLSAPAETPSTPPAAAMPDWLRRAVEEVQRPALFALGARGLVKASGRSAEHVARTLRAVRNETPSDFVNRVRMTHAARELRTTDRPIADIALECRLSNLSHFYALFRAAHGRAPRAYRVLHQRAVV